MPIRLCPACDVRKSKLVDPDCPICLGGGTVRLGSAGVFLTSPAITSRSLDYIVEAAARRADESGRPSREVLIEVMRKARDLGIVQAQATDTDLEAADVAAAFGYQPGDGDRISSPPLRFDPADQPHAHGAPPRISADGHQSYLARAVDPIEGEWTAAGLAAENRTVDFQARVLAEATPEAHSIRSGQKGRRGR